MTMNASTKRSLRTIYHGVIGLIGAIPTIILLIHSAGLDKQDSVAAAIPVVLLWSAAASKAINSLEDKGLIPAWLKDEPVVVPPEPTDGTTAAPAPTVDPTATASAPAATDASAPAAAPPTDPQPPTPSD